jgi:hypothetical protein
MHNNTMDNHSESGLPSNAILLAKVRLPAANAGKATAFLAHVDKIGR